MSLPKEFTAGIFNRFFKVKTWPLPR